MATMIDHMIRAVKLDVDFYNLRHTACRRIQRARQAQTGL